MILGFQRDVTSLTSASVVVGSGADFQIHSDVRENGFSPLNPENLLFNITGAVLVLFPVFTFTLTLASKYVMFQ